MVLKSSKLFKNNVCKKGKFMNEKFDIIRLIFEKRKRKIASFLKLNLDENVKNRKTSFIIKCKF